MRFNRKLLYIFFFLLLGIDSKSQEVDSLKIIPVSPTSSENIQVIAYTLHPNMSCPLFNSTVNTSNDTIYVTAFHSIGMLPAMCNSTDTITIGSVMSGNYVLIYNVIDTILPNPGDTDTLLFSVQGIMETQDHRKKEILIYPNPATEKICFELEQDLNENGIIDMYSMKGKKVMSTILSNSLTLHIGHLHKGMYFIHYSFGNRTKTQKVLIQ